MALTFSGTTVLDLIITIPLVLLEEICIGLRCTSNYEQTISNNMSDRERNDSRTNCLSEQAIR